MKSIATIVIILLSTLDSFALEFQWVGVEFKRDCHYVGGSCSWSKSKWHGFSNFPPYLNGVLQPASEKIADKINALKTDKKYNCKVKVFESSEGRLLMVYEIDQCEDRQ